MSLQTAPVGASSLPITMTPSGSVVNHLKLPLESLVRYIAFVLPLSAVATVLFFAVPLSIRNSKNICTGFRCSNFEDDLSKSLRQTEDPCRNFQDYVCRNWNEKLYPTLYAKYSYLNVREVSRYLFKAELKRTEQTALHKSATLMLKCGNQEESTGVDAIRALMKDLRLTWPYKSHATSLEVLDTVVAASLDFSIPLLFSFKIGRHPIDHQRNTIYIAVDNLFFMWINHIATLKQKRAEQTYLRRCAEVVGSSGQSYNRMIQDVLWTHRKVVGILRSPIRLYFPKFQNLSDFQLRVAINRHLPDSSQLWPVDEVINFTHDLFIKVRTFFRGTNENLKRVKLYLGAYVVWYISPFASYYLTRSMMEDMGHRDQVEIFIRSRCYQMIHDVMPLVVWKIEDEHRQNETKHTVQEVLDEVKTYIYKLMFKLDSDIANASLPLLSDLSLSTFNATASWDLLTRVYSYVPDLQGDFMTTFLKATSSTVHYFKEDINEPDSDVTHIPSMVSTDTYRLLVNREIRTPSVIQQSPLVFANQKSEVKMGTLGVHFTLYILYMLYFTYAMNERFVEKPVASSPHLLEFNGMYKLFQQRSIVSELSKAEQFELFMVMLAVSLSRDALLTTVDKAAEPIRAFNYMPSLTPEQLFFISSCLVHCTSSEGVLNVSVCNMAVAQACGFSRAFGCVDNGNNTNFHDPSCHLDRVLLTIPEQSTSPASFH